MVILEAPWHPVNAGYLRRSGTQTLPLKAAAAWSFVATVLVLSGVLDCNHMFTVLTGCVSVRWYLGI